MTAAAARDEVLVVAVPDAHAPPRFL